MTEHASSVSDRFGWLLRVARERKSRHELAVAIALAAHVNTRTGTAWPSTRTIADQCGVDLRHAWHALRRLADAGLLRVVAAGGPARSATYALELGEQSEVTHPDASQRRTPMRRNTEVPGGTRKEPECARFRARAPLPLRAPRAARIRRNLSYHHSDHGTDYDRRPRPGTRAARPPLR